LDGVLDAIGDMCMIFCWWTFTQKNQKISHLNYKK
jgi:hypothetical protein